MVEKWKGIESLITKKITLSRFFQFRPDYDDRYRPTQRWERPTTTPAPTKRPLGSISVRINSPRNRFPLNSQISIPCTVNSYSQPNVYWSKDGRRLSDSRKTQVR